MGFTESERIVRQLFLRGEVSPALQAAILAAGGNPDMFASRNARDGQVEWFAESAPRNIAIWEKLGRVPTFVSHDPEELRSSQWWSHQRHAFKCGTMPAGQLEYLNEHAPEDWSTPLHDEEAEWRANADRSIEWRLTKHLKPPGYSRTREYAHNSGWWWNQRWAYHCGIMSPDRVDYLDQRAPGWRDGIQPTREWKPPPGLPRERRPDGGTESSRVEVAD